MNYRETLAAIEAADTEAMEKARAYWDTIAKPPNSLGKLERDITKIIGMTRNPKVDISKRTVIAMCADNGVVEEGFAASDPEVTAIITELMGAAISCVCRMAKVANCDVLAVDIGVLREVTGANILQRNVRRATRNLAKEPAMTMDEVIQAIEVGIETVQELAAKGYNLFATGEMGIGNTTSSSAVASVLLGCEVEDVTGRGAGLSDEGLVRKIEVIKNAISLHQPDPNNPLDVLAKVGGLDIAGLVGVYLACSALRLPVLVDGLISSVAALVAVRLCPAVSDYLIASHISAEPAGSIVLDALELEPIINADMCLGEGTGAVAAIPILDMAAVVFNEMATYEDTSIEDMVNQI